MDLLKTALFGAFFLCLIFTSLNVNAEEFSFETDFFQYRITSRGVSSGLQEKESGRDWLANGSSPFARVALGGETFPATKLWRNKDTLRVKFGTSGITARYRIVPRKTHIVIELTALTGVEPDSIDLCSLQTKAFSKTGAIIAAQWDDQITICLMALSERVNSRVEGGGILSSTVYPPLGVIGEKVALIAAPTSRFLDVVQDIEKSYHLPSPAIGGKWAKLSPDVDTNYLFTDLSEKTAHEIIAYARTGGFKYVLIPCGAWASSRGTYPINLENFPQGEKSLTRTIDQFHKAGLKVGMHMLTSLVGKNDPLVRPKPDPRLLKDATVILAEDIEEQTTSLAAKSRIDAFSKVKFNSAACFSKSVDIQVEDEILNCAEIGAHDPHRFSKCRRGCYGTLKKSHGAGARISRLVQGANSYLADLNTSLKEDIAERISGIINRCGFDMLYFDAGELNRANEPGWYYVGLQQTAIWKRLDRDVLLQGSGMSHWLWHVISRGTCDDHAAVAVEAYMDHHKLKTLQTYGNNFMPAELGWCALLSGDLDHAPTSLNHIDHYGARMIAFDVPISIQTSRRQLEINPQTRRLLQRLRQIDNLRCNGIISESQRKKLASGRWTLFDDTGKVNISPIKPEVIPPPENHRQRDLKIDKNQILFQGRIALDCPNTEKDDFRPGALIERVNFPNNTAGNGKGDAPPNPVSSQDSPVYKDLRNHRALVVVLSAEGVAENASVPHPVINIQLQDDRRRFRDHFIDLDFSGGKTVVIPRANAERLLREFHRPAYNIKSALRYFNYQKVTAINLRWMRKPKSSNAGKYYIHLIKAISD